MPLKERSGRHLLMITKLSLPVLAFLISQDSWSQAEARSSAASLSMMSLEGGIYDKVTEMDQDLNAKLLRLTKEIEDKHRQLMVGRAVSKGMFYVADKGLAAVESLSNVAMAANPASGALGHGTKLALTVGKEALETGISAIFDAADKRADALYRSAIVSEYAKRPERLKELEALPESQKISYTMAMPGIADRLDKVKDPREYAMAVSGIMDAQQKALKNDMRRLVQTQIKQEATDRGQDDSIGQALTIQKTMKKELVQLTTNMGKLTQAQGDMQASLENLTEDSAWVQKTLYSQMPLEQQKKILAGNDRRANLIEPDPKKRQTSVARMNLVLAVSKVDKHLGQVASFGNELVGVLQSQGIKSPQAAKAVVAFTKAKSVSDVASKLINQDYFGATMGVLGLFKKAGPDQATIYHEAAMEQFEKLNGKLDEEFQIIRGRFDSIDKKLDEGFSEMKQSFAAQKQQADLNFAKLKEGQRSISQSLDRVNENVLKSSALLSAKLDDHLYAIHEVTRMVRDSQISATHDCSWFLVADENKSSGKKNESFRRLESPESLRSYTRFAAQFQNLRGDLFLNCLHSMSTLIGTNHINFTNDRLPSWFTFKTSEPDQNMKVEDAERFMTFRKDVWEPLQALLNDLHSVDGHGVDADSAIVGFLNPVDTNRKLNEKMKFLSQRSLSENDRPMNFAFIKKWVVQDFINPYVVMDVAEYLPSLYFASLVHDTEGKRLNSIEEFNRSPHLVSEVQHYAERMVAVMNASIAQQALLSGDLLLPSIIRKLQSSEGPEAEIYRRMLIRDPRLAANVLSRIVFEIMAQRDAAQSWEAYDVALSSPEYVEGNPNSSLLRQILPSYMQIERQNDTWYWVIRVDSGVPGDKNFLSLSVKFPPSEDYFSFSEQGTLAAHPLLIELLQRRDALLKLLSDIEIGKQISQIPELKKSYLELNHRQAH